MSMRATIGLPAPTAADQTHWRIEYSVNGVANRPAFEVPAADTTFDLPHSSDPLTLEHGDTVDVHLYAKDGAGNLSAPAQLVFQVQDTVPPPQPLSPTVVGFTQL